MINQVQKFLLIPCLIILFLFSSACGILKPPHVDSQGYYTIHYNSCGPTSIKNALARYYTENGIKFKRAYTTTKQISQSIQDNDLPFPFNARECLIVLDRDAAQLTWPHEIKMEMQRHGIKLRTVDMKYLKANPDETYIILVHKKWTIDQYHWFAYPNYAPLNYYGDETVFDKIYLLEPLQR